MPSTVANTQVKIQLSTKDPSISLPNASNAILINTDLRRRGLSTLVNHLLSTPQPVPLDFLVNGTSFLRNSVDDYLLENGLSSETVLDIEYVRASVPPAHVASYPHDAWLSSVDVLSSSSATRTRGHTGDTQTISSGQERILTGAFDGSLRVWTTSGETLAQTDPVEQRGSVMAVRASHFISHTRVVSTGYDRVVRLWSYDEDLGSRVASLTPKLELHGHRKFVSSLDVHSSSNRILSASDDMLIGIWSTEATEAPAAPEQTTQGVSTGKRRKTAGEKVTQRGALALLKGHTGAATAAVFDPQDRTVGFSVSQDHSLRTWDLTTGAAVDTRSTSHPLLSLAVLPEHNLVAAGTSVRHITLIDPRASSTKVAAMTLRGHTGWVSCLAGDPNKGHRLLSGSYDGTCRIWDIRAAKMGSEGAVGESVFAIPRRGKKDESKVFGVCWDADLGIAIAGEDKQVHIERFS